MNAYLIYASRSIMDGPRFLSQLTIKKSSFFCSCERAILWCHSRLEWHWRRLKIDAVDVAKLRRRFIIGYGIFQGGGFHFDLIWNFFSKLLSSKGFPAKKVLQ